LFFHGDIAHGEAELNLANETAPDCIKLLSMVFTAFRGSAIFGENFLARFDPSAIPISILSNIKIEIILTCSTTEIN